MERSAERGSGAVLPPVLNLEHGVGLLAVTDRRMLRIAPACPGDLLRDRERQDPLDAAWCDAVFLGLFSSTGCFLEKLG